ncbi:MAG: hypothetical protein JW900_09090 [Anaerolineae bacterium]|nr:hypothetical protein [Anaerolineae bacterium]
MIHLTAEFTPANLLYCAGVAETTMGHLRRADREKGRNQLAKAAQHVKAVIQQGRQGQSEIDLAVALIYQSDLYREMMKFDHARRSAQEAHSIFKLQSSQEQRHNEAVAAYSLALAWHVLGDERAAGKWYRTARQTFQAAREYWAIQPDPPRYRTCTRMSQWVERLRDSLGAEEKPAPPYHSFLVPAWLSQDTDTFLAAKLAVVGYVVDQSVTIDGQSFRLDPLTGGVVIFTTGEYRIFQVPDEIHAAIDAQKGDYVLVRRTGQANLNVPYYVVEAATGPVFGRFERGVSDAVQNPFVSIDARLIGKIVDDLPIYYPLALLTPEP